MIYQMYIYIYILGMDRGLILENIAKEHFLGGHFAREILRFTLVLIVMSFFYIPIIIYPFFSEERLILIE